PGGIWWAGWSDWRPTACSARWLAFCEVRQSGEISRIVDGTSIDIEFKASFQSQEEVRAVSLCWSQVHPSDSAHHVVATDLRRW
ncbi:unnamed protein product, partial [Ectocarpus fasciculatus]